MSYDLKRLDDLETTQQFVQVFDELKEIHEKDPTNPQILFRFARAHWDLAEEKPKDGKYRQQQYTLGLELAQKAIQVDPNCGPAHKWVAIILSSMGEFIPTKEKILNAYKIKEHTEKAIAYDPKDATAYHILGSWCKTIANVGWMERKIASAIMAAPPESSFEEALKNYLKCHEIEPNFRRNIFAVGETYYLMKNYSEAKKWYQKVIDMPNVSEADRGVTQQAVDQLKRC